MNKHTACALYLSFLSLPALAQSAAVAPESAQAASAASTPAPVAEAGVEPEPARVVVEGRRPGPGVWKVSKDGHVLWVFGLYSPLPQKMEWDASRVERLVAHSQEVLLPPRASIDVGFWRGLTLLPTAIGMQKNPDGATLKDLVPPDVYARWQVLKGKYLGDDDGIERYRPIFAGELLLQAGLKKNGLSQDIDVRQQIEKIAKQNEIKQTATGVDIQVEDPRSLLKEFKKSSLEDVVCFTKTLANLEDDIEGKRLRANAWAKGNIAEITQLDYAEREQACGDAILDSPLARRTPALQNVHERIRAAWLSAAEKSLAANASTFAVLQMKVITGPQGYLADLQAKGYTVENPK